VVKLLNGLPHALRGHFIRKPVLETGHDALFFNRAVQQDFFIQILRLATPGDKVDE
jgi:hypothetical protein